MSLYIYLGLSNPSIASSDIVPTNEEYLKENEIAYNNYFYQKVIVIHAKLLGKKKHFIVCIVMFVLITMIITACGLVSV
jgi:hypothetical protein